MQLIVLAFSLFLVSWMVSLGYSGNLKVSLSHLSTLYLPLKSADGSLEFVYANYAVEQLGFHSPSKTIYAVGNYVIYIIDASDLSKLTLKGVVTIKDLVLTDAEVCGDALFVAYQNGTDKLQGGLRVYKLDNAPHGADTLKLLHDIPMGSLPDMLTTSPNCTVVVAIENEGFVQEGKFYDPPGGLGIVRFPSGVTTQPRVTILDFSKFDSQFERLARTGVRWVFRGNGNNFSNNVEPEYAAFNHDYSKAYVNLQENNAIAVVDLVTDTITDIYGLGFKQWGELDASDKDGGINIAPWPVYGMYLPDAIKCVHWNGQDYIITANEGDAQEYLDPVGFSEKIRGSQIAAADIADSVDYRLREALNDTKMGRLMLSKMDGKNSEGKFERFFTYGGRSFSIWNASQMALVFDSGSQLEKAHAQQRPDLFNSNFFGSDRLSDSMDTLSDDKGPEPESLAVGEVAGHLLIFVGNERPGTIAVFSVAPGGLNPQFQSLFTGGIPTQRESSTWEQLYAKRELYGLDPEDILFLPASVGLADYPVLLMTGSVTGTVSALKVDVTMTGSDTGTVSALKGDARMTGSVTGTVPVLKGVVNQQSVFLAKSSSADYKSSTFLILLLCVSAYWPV